MSDGLLNSSLPSRNYPKASVKLDGAAYFSLDLDGADVGDEVVYVIRGTIKEKAQSHYEKDGRSITLLITDVQDQTPRKDRDETNRIQ